MAIIKRIGQIRHMKELKRSGLNATSGNFPAGSNVRVIHSPAATGRRRGK